MRALKHVCRVAIIDDDAQIQNFLQDVLEDLSITSEHWLEGTTPALIEEFAPDLIILDVQMHLTDAFAIIRFQIPPACKSIISISSGTSTQTVAQAMLLGERSGFSMAPPLLKPVTRDSIHALLAATDELLERRHIGHWASHDQEEQKREADLSLRKALDEGLLEVWYQPKFEAANRAICGAEALVRGRTPDGKIVAPYQMLTGASRSELSELTDYVLSTATRDYGPLILAGFHHKISVNVPVSYLVDGDPCQLIRHASMAPDWPGMIFEITEDEALQDIIMAQMVATQLSLYGITLSIDDFGAAYSSLSRLKDLPFSEIKLDRSFVHHCSTDKIRKSICSSVLSLGNALDIVTVAEGVETEEDFAFLRESGCTQIQGYLLGRPMPLSALLEFVVASLGHGKCSRAAVG